MNNDEVINTWILYQEKYHQMTLERLADIDAGDFIDHKYIQAWAERLGTDKQIEMP